MNKIKINNSKLSYVEYKGAIEYQMTDLNDVLKVVNWIGLELKFKKFNINTLDP